jgi:hypothetical protein
MCQDFIFDAMQRETDIAGSVRSYRGNNSRAGGSKFLKRQTWVVFFLLLIDSAPAAVNVFVQDSNAMAWIKYECTAGEVIRAFALNVAVDKGRIISIADFLRGPSTAAEPGYGIFPASFRDHIAVGPGTNLNWNVGDYTPLAVVADDPENTLPGLDSAGVTLEFGGLWDPAVPGAVPGPTGTLCSLRISERATVSVAPNPSRGGVLAADPTVILTPTFIGAVVQPQIPEITGLSLTNGFLSVTFAGGELETAPAISGPWTGTGNTAGQHSETIAGGTNKFYRVRGL